ncbi:basic proline-rich protein [Papio anubis]|uniref:basic proline-rich protein n=1 Tax=Papio anubis TaxID=9555 RepID=UPI0012AD802D|nr:basic proline-rich protein [Papio anubis]
MSSSKPLAGFRKLLNPSKAPLSAGLSKGPSQGPENQTPSLQLPLTLSMPFLQHLALSTLSQPGVDAFGKTLGPPPPWRAPRDWAAAGTSAQRARPEQGARPALLPPRRRSRRGRAGGSRGARGRRVRGRKDLQQYLREEAAGAAAAAAAAAAGGWRRRQRQRRRCPGTPPPIVPSPGQALPRAPHWPPPARRPRPAPRAPRPAPRAVQPALTLQRPAVPRSLKLLIPGKLARDPGTNPQTKSETSAGLERLLVGAFPPPSSPPSPPPPLGLPCGALSAGG